MIPADSTKEHDRNQDVLTDEDIDTEPCWTEREKYNKREEKKMKLISPVS